MGGPEHFSWLAEDAATEHTLLMGATTYRLFAGFAADGADGIDELTRRPKVVFSRTLQAPLGWKNSTLVRQEAAPAVRALRAEGALPLRTIGSPTLCRSLVAAGLVDRYRVVVFPVVTGATGHDRDLRRLARRPARARHLPDVRRGLQLLEYVPTVLDGPPAA